MALKAKLKQMEKILARTSATAQPPSSCTYGINLKFPTFFLSYLIHELFKRLAL